MKNTKNGTITIKIGTDTYKYLQFIKNKYGKSYKVVVDEAVKNYAVKKYK